MTTLRPDYYETDAQLNEYLVFHYADARDTLPWSFGPTAALGFHRRLVECLDLSVIPDDACALDLGCGVGRVSFELARYCARVTGIDYSHAFVDAARRVANSGEVRMILKREGDLGDAVNRKVVQDIERERVGFEHGDAENLPAELGAFDVLVMANVLDRLPHPRRALARLAALVKPGGQAILCSPFTWWDSFTTPEERLGGYVRDASEVTSLDSLKESLLPDFELAEVQDQPFLIREHARKYHFSVAETTRWIRR